MKNKFIAIIIIFVLFTINKISAQSFTFSLTPDSISFGLPGGNDIVVKGDISNAGTTDLNIDVLRKENNLPLNWGSYICIDVCMPPTADSARLYLPAGQSQTFRLSFIVTNVLDTANALIVFKNAGNSANKFKQRMYAITKNSIGISELYMKNESIKLFPNPASEIITINSKIPLTNIKCFNSEGKCIFNDEFYGNSYRMNSNELCPGKYFIEAVTGDGKIILRNFIKN